MLARGLRQVTRGPCSALLRCMASTTSAEQLSAIKSLRERSGAPMADVRAALMQADWKPEDALQELRKKGLAASSKKASRNAAQGLVGLASEGDAAVLVEVNSETDFVARNDQFIGMVGQVAAAALHIPASGRQGGQLDTEALQRATTSEGTSAAAAVDAVAGVVREKMALRRGVKLEAPGGVVGSYLHASPAPGVGRMGALVGLQTGSGADLSAADAKAAAQELAGKLAMHVVAMRPPYLSRETVPDSVRAAEGVMLQSQAAQSGKPANVLEKMVVGRLNKYYQDVCLLEQPYVMDDSQRVQDVIKKFNGLYRCDVHVSAFVRLQVGEDLKEGVQRGQLVLKPGKPASADVDKVGRPTAMAELQH